MAEHDLKCWSNSFDATERGDKRYWVSGWSRAFQRYNAHLIWDNEYIRERRCDKSWRRLCLARARVREYKLEPPPAGVL